VVIFTVYSQSPLPAALMCYLADIPLRLAHCRENPYQLLTHWVPDPEPHQRLRHEARRHLDLVRTIGCQTRDERIPLTIPEDARQSVKRMLQDLGLRDSRKWVVIHPGASAPSRRYPPESIAKVARCLVKNSGLQVLFTGSRDEVGLVEEVRHDMKAPSLSLAGTLNLAHLAALLSYAPVLISNNTGPVHVAAAVGTPVVDLYALTNPQHTPWGVPHRVLYHDVPCKFCYKSICLEGHHNCLRLVTPESVVNAVLELLSVPIHAGGPQNGLLPADGPKVLT
jgi:lipopolysaccharide heptosyltransferase II